MTAYELVGWAGAVAASAVLMTLGLGISWIVWQWMRGDE